MPRPKTIVLTSRHDFGIEGTKARLNARFDALKASYLHIVADVDATWVGDVAHVRAGAFGQTGTAVCEVEAAQLKITIELPWLIAGMAGMIESILKSNAGILVREQGPAAIAAGAETSASTGSPAIA